LALIAQNHLQLIIEFGLVLYLGVIFILSLAPISLSAVLLFSLLLGLALSVLFGIDAIFLFVSFGQSEFSHPFGPIALLAIVTALAALPMMKEAGIGVGRLKLFIYFVLILLTVFGGLVHRSFLILWILGLLIGFLILSKSFRQKSILSIKKIVASIVAVLAAFGILELLSSILQMPVLSPLLRIARIESNSGPGLNLVINNITILGHIQNSSFWGSSGLGFGDGYITLPINLITSFGLPFPVFYGLLVNKKDVVDYMLPGIFGWGYDFGYLTLLFLLLWCVGVIIIGFKMLVIYRDKRENGSRRFLGREALLIGSLTAFIAQAVVGLFLMNRTVNGMALLTFIFLSALVVGHIITLKKD
jgi:hypothetical protein